MKKATSLKSIGVIVLLNLLFVLIIGYLTLDVSANINSQIGAYVLSALLPFLIVTLTPGLSPTKRLAHYGTGIALYLLLALFTVNITHAITCGLIPCLVIFLGLVYAGDKIFPQPRNSSASKAVG